LAPVERWLEEKGRLIQTPAAFIEQVMARVVAAGVPVWRMYIGLQLIHPQLQAMGYLWRRGDINWIRSTSAEKTAVPGAEGLPARPEPALAMK